jgi:uncharacterized membrane protein YoaK (UPF0700 family)
MNTNERRDLSLAVSLTAVAGCVDAIGFLKTGGLFVSFMSGNSTQFAVATGGGAWDQSFITLGIIALFVVAVACGRVLELATHPWNRMVVLLSEAALLSISGLSSGFAAIVLMVTAMGIQNSVVRRAGDAKTGLTYVTGTLVTLGEKLGDAFHCGRARQRWAWVPQFVLWTGFIAGGVSGALLYRGAALKGLFVPAILLVLLAIGTRSRGSEHT